MFSTQRWTNNLIRNVWLLGLTILLAGCGTTRERRATDQLLLSDAVDRSIAQLNFGPFTGEKVYLDTKYLTMQPDQIANVNYVTSSIRQQLFRYGCLLQPTEADADFIIEARIGTLGSDGHEVNFGIPASNTMSAAASAIVSVPAIPAIPEISFARRSVTSSAAKLALFAYRRATKEPVWQSGLAIGRSNATGRWVLGVGPFESGTIHDGTRFAGKNVDKKNGKSIDSPQENSTQDESYRQTALYDQHLLNKILAPSDNAATTPEAKLAEHQETATPPPAEPQHLPATK